MARKRTRVVVYGSSLFLAGIAASLEKEEATVEVIRVDPRHPLARQRVRDLRPDVIAFDTSRPDVGLDIVPICRGLGSLLVGADPNSEELLLLARRSEPASCVADLLKVIREMNGAEDGSRGEVH